MFLLPMYGGFATTTEYRSSRYSACRTTRSARSSTSARSMSPPSSKLGDVLLEANGQLRVGLDQRPEGVGVLELVPEGCLGVLVAAAGQQEVDLVRA